MLTTGPAPAYLPLRLADRLGPEGESECRFPGTVMVADIAGFARLTATSAGEEGTERLTQTLGRAFRGGLDAVEAFSGEMVYFAGDALICYWPADPEQATRDVALAGACARALASAAAQPGAPPLRVGVASGPLWAAKIGGWSGRFNLLFGGRGTRAAFAAARCAAAGQVWMSAAACRGLQGSSGADAAHDGEGPPERVDGLLAELAEQGRLPAPTLVTDPGAGAPGHQDLLPPDIERRAELDDGIWSPELRSIDCLFLRLPTLSEDSPDAFDQFRRALSLAQQRLRAPSATGRLVIDDKGLTLVWVAGEPQAGRALSPETSLALAAQTFEALAGAGLQPAAGFASGRAFCATLGNDRRREPVVVGMPMVVAARLMDRGEPLLLAADPPAAPAGQGLRLEAGPAVPLKGFPAPVPIFRVRPGAPPAPASDLVGRDGELAAAEASLDDLAAGRGGILLITAPAGMGKSALVRALRAAAARRRLPYGQGEAYGAERRVAYFAWRAVARTLLGDLPFDEPEALRRRLAEELARAGRDPGLAPLLEPVFPAGFVESEQTRKIVGENRARTTQDLLLVLFAQLLVGPQVIALEDLHHMDTPSLQLLEHAARRLPRALFLLTMRPQEVPDASETLARANRRIDLSPLRPGDFAELARSRLGLSLSPAVAEDICRRAHGIPLYGAEYLRQAREALGPDQRAETIAELPASMTEPQPIASDPLRGVLIRSFDGLSAIENRALKAASVLGERFGRDTLEAIAGEGEREGEPAEARLDLGPALHGLQQRGLVLAGAGDPGQHRFAHALIQLSCYETIPLHLRRLLHGRAAARLEGALPPGPAEVSDERVLSLAHHHHFAGNFDRSIHWSGQAAERARRQGAYREAMRLLDQCLEAAERLRAPGTDAVQRAGGLDPRVRWRRLKAEAAGAVGDGQARIREAEQAIALAGVRSPRRRIWRALAGVAGLLRRTVSRPERLLRERPSPLPSPRRRGEGKRAAGGEQLLPGEASGSVSEVAVFRELARAHRQLATGAYFLGHSVEMAFNTSRALAYAERVGRSAELSDCLASVGTVYGLTGFAGPARRHLAAARVMASEIGDDAAMAYAEVSSALFSIGQGDWESARMQADRCQAISRRTGDTGYWGYGQALRFWMHHYQGETEAADSCAAALWEGSREAGNRQHQSWAARFLAQGCARRGEWALARERLETARSLYHEAEKKSRELRPIYELQPILADLGAALFELGQHGEAHVLEDGALRALGSSRRPPGHAVLEGCSSIARVELAVLGHKNDAEALARGRRAIQLLRRYCAVFPIGQPRLAYWRGRLLAFTGRRVHAQAVWRAGLAAARVLGMAYDEKLLESALRV